MMMAPRSVSRGRSQCGSILCTVVLTTGSPGGHRHPLLDRLGFAQPVGVSLIRLRVVLAGVVLVAVASGCGGLDPAVEQSVVFMAERPGEFVFEDAALSDWLVGEREVSKSIVAVAVCHSLVGHAGDWSVGPRLVVSSRVDLVRVAEMVESGEFSRALAERFESYLFVHADEVIDAATLSRGATISAPVVERYLQLRSPAPSPKALAKYGVYVQNATTTVQRLVVVNRARMSDVDFEGLSWQYASAEYQAAGQSVVASVGKADCARLVPE